MKRQLLMPSAVTVIILGAFFLSHAGANTAAVGAPAQPSLAGDLLPDLRVEPSETVELAGAGRRRKLRFSTDVANLGPGPLEVVPRKEHCHRVTESSNERTSYQAISTRGGGLRSVRVGCMHFHAEHDHWHFDRFVSAQLRRAADGQLVAGGAKVSFCLQDSVRSERVPDARADEERYSGCEADAAMGISAGWVDSYDSDLSGQGIKIGRISPGRYRLVLHADPENRVAERNERNNRAAVTLELSGNHVRRVPEAG